MALVKAEEIRSHTAMRGIAALLVVIYHFRPTLQPAMDLDLHTHFFAKGYLWVDFFFILSGFILCHVYATRPGSGERDIMEFWWSRFARIYPLHIATLMLLVFWQIVASAALHRSVRVGEWSTFWLNLLNIHAWGFLDRYDWNFPSWSISAEMAAYITFPVICVGLLRRRRAAITSMGLMLAAYVLYLIVADDPRGGWERKALITCLPMFFLGVLLYQCRNLALRTGDHLCTAFQLVAALGIVIALHEGWNDAFVIFPFALLVFSTQMDAGFLARALSSKPLVIVGLWSYSIYMLHIPVSLILEVAWPKLVAIPLGLTIGQSAASLFTTSILMTIIAGVASYLIFETPVRRALRTFALDQSNSTNSKQLI